MYDELIARNNCVLSDLLEQTKLPAPILKAAINYCLFPGGKRLRPILVYLCGELLGVDLQSLDIIAAAIELTHCYSLVHDDLPAMDNDDWRRGRPSCHRAFGEATAILAGDAMQVLALDLLLSRMPCAPSSTIEIAKALIRASGALGMISGQSLDLSELSKPYVSLEELWDIHRLKTGKLMLACVEMVLIIAPQDEVAFKALRAFGGQFGLAFQIQDDYLDAYGVDLGKKRRADSANHKTSFASFYAEEELRSLVDQSFIELQTILAVFADKARRLHDFVALIWDRTKLK